MRNKIPWNGRIAKKTRTESETTMQVQRRRGSVRLNTGIFFPIIDKKSDSVIRKDAERDKKRDK